MFLPDPFGQPDPIQREKQLTAPTPAQIVDNLLKSAFPVRTWSSEQRWRYTNSLDPVLRAHLQIGSK